MVSPSIACIIPAYNISDYIAEALESALNQDPPFCQIVVVDDGSTDDTRVVVSGYVDPRLRYFRQENHGLGPARNTGLELVDADFIYFMDGDDVLLPGLTRSFHEALREKPDLDLFAFSALDFEHGSYRDLPSSVYMQRKRSGEFSTGRDALIDGLKRNDFPVCVFLYIFRRSKLDVGSVLRFQNIVHEDELFTPAVFMRCGTSVFTTALFYRRRVRLNSIMTTPASVRNVIGYLSAARWWLDAADSESDTDRMLLLKSAQFFYARSILYAARAHLSYQDMRSLTEKHAPEYLPSLWWDLVLSLLSRKLAFNIISKRSPIF